MPIPEVRGVQLHRSRWPLLVGGAIVLLIGIAAAVVFVRRSAPAPVANTPAKDVNAAVNVAAVGTNTQAEQVVASPDIVTNDKDRDGLTDEEEQKLGTKDTVADTDGDALSDYDEVKVYKTNPLKPDTDGDGNPDGAEVKKGYNPNGTGMLLDFEAARQKLTP
ncbi:MAG: hypothetical protein Q8O51_02290 [bacterium]|nr:hypothetical protein [bacterium]